MKRSAPHDDRSSGNHDPASSPRKRLKVQKIQPAGPGSAPSAVRQADDVFRTGASNDTNVTPPRMNRKNSAVALASLKPDGSGWMMVRSASDNPVTNYSSETSLAEVAASELTREEMPAVSQQPYGRHIVNRQSSIFL